MNHNMRDHIRTRNTFVRTELNYVHTENNHTCTELNYVRTEINRPRTVLNYVHTTLQSNSGALSCLSLRCRSKDL